MFNRRTLTVIKRELRTHLLSKSFLLMTFLVPVFLFGIMAIQTFILNYEGDEGAKIFIAAENESITNKLREELDKQEFIQKGYYKVSYETLANDELKSFIDSKRKEIADEKLTGIIYISSAAEKTKEPAFYSKNPKNTTLFNKLNTHINKVLIDNYFTGKMLSQEELSFAQDKVDFKEYKVSDQEEIKEEGYGNIVVSFLFTFLLYFSLLIFGSSTLTAVIEEKNSRVVEVLLSSLNSKELLTGKIFGTSITGLAQMAIWLSPVVFVVSTTYFILPEKLTLSLQAGQLVYFLLNYFIALLTFIGLYAAVGSIFNNVQDAQGANWPVMMLIIIPFFIAVGLQTNPNNNIGKIASMLPFASLIVMPARITIVDVPVWQFALAIAVNLTTLFLMFPLAGKIYRIGILSTGKKPKWGEVVKWLKYKY